MATMMLLTYSYYSEIPSKIHIFYQQAFEALYQRHDRSKGVYTRKTVSQLPIDQFQRALEYFCASGYVSQRYSFGEVEVREMIAESLSYVGLNTSPESYLSDLMISTCLLKRDGIEIAFVHRSFQEYFCARFLSRLDDESAYKAIESISERAGTDKVLEMLVDMDTDLFERSWVIPRARDLIDFVGGDIHGNEYKLIPQIFDRAFLSPDRITLSNTSDQLSRAAYVLWNLYDVSTKEGQPEAPGEVFVGFDTVKQNPELLSELREAIDSGHILKSYLGEKSDDGGLSKIGFLSLEKCSKALLDAMHIDSVARREYQSWVRILNESEGRAHRKVKKLDQLLANS